MPKSFADQMILHDLRASNGTAVAVSDKAILDAQYRLASSEGIFAAPEGAATLAALEKLVEEGWVHPDERIVLFNTGTGLKYVKQPGANKKKSGQKIPLSFFYMLRQVSLNVRSKLLQPLHHRFDGWAVG